MNINKYNTEKEEISDAISFKVVHLKNKDGEEMSRMSKNKEKYASPDFFPRKSFKLVHLNNKVDEEICPRSNSFKLGPF